MIESVLLVTSRFPPDAGGVEQYVFGLAQQLVVRAGLRVVVVTTGPVTARRYRTYGALTVYRLPRSYSAAKTPMGFGWAQRLGDIIRVEGVDLVNAHAPAPGLPDMAAQTCGDLPFVLTYHNASIRKEGWLPGLAAGAYERFVLPRTIRRADRVICSSGQVAEHFSAAFEGKAVTVPPGADLTAFTPAPLPTGAPRILFVAPLPYRGLSDLLRAVAELRTRGRTVELDVVGDGNQQRYVDLARTLGITEAVSFHGHLVGEDLVRLYHDATVVALPAYRESFPTVLLEAMACGRPVVATAVGAIPTFVEHDVNGLLGRPGDHLGLVDRLNDVISDRALAERLARAGREIVVADLSWERQTRRTMEVYLEAKLARSGDLPVAL